MSYKKLYFLGGISFIMILLFSISYEIAFSRIKVAMAYNEMSKIIKTINIQNIYASKKETDGRLQIEYKVYFKLPSKLKLNDIKNSFGLSLQFKDKSKEILNIESTPISKDFNPGNNERQFIASFLVDFPSTKTEELDLVIQNRFKDTRIILHNEKKAIKSVQLSE